MRFSFVSKANPVWPIRGQGVVGDRALPLDKKQCVGPFFIMMFLGVFLGIFCVDFFMNCSVSFFVCSSAFFVSDNVL